MKTSESPHINVDANTICFHLHDDSYAHVCLAGASHVSLSNSFNNWAQDVLFMKQDDRGTWNIEIPMLPKGTYHYKFFVDDKLWIEDISNRLREPDGATGFKSVLTV